MSNTPDPDKLLALCQTNPAALAIVQAALDPAFKGSPPEDFPLHDAFERFGIGQARALDAARLIVNTNCAFLIMGRHGNVTRLNWRVSRKLMRDTMRTARRDAPMATTSGGGDLVKVRFALDAGERELTLPRAMTQAECDTLSRLAQAVVEDFPPAGA